MWYLLLVSRLASDAGACVPVASLLLVSLVLRVTIRFCRPAAELHQTQHQFDLLTCHLNTVMSVMGQGWAGTPDSLPARIVTLSGWVLGNCGPM